MARETVLSAEAMPAGSLRAGDLPGSWRRQMAFFRGSEKAPLLTCIAGLHGNEAMGVRALEEISATIAGRKSRLRGGFVALAGNLQALSRGLRYLSSDLNRMWTSAQIARLHSTDPSAFCAEDFEQKELLSLIETLRRLPSGEKYFLDLHTTSAEGGPFTVFGDTLRNRAFADHFPVTKILGLEELIDGPLLEFTSRFGAVGVGFEAGQHEDPHSTELHKAAIWIGLVASGVLDEDDCPEFQGAKLTLAEASRSRPRAVEVRHREPVRAAGKFEMKLGYYNFRPVAKGELLAQSSDGPVYAKRSGRILMPLYQKQGEDGFFVVTDISPFWLFTSKWMRRLRLSDLIRFLPGIERCRLDKDRLEIESSSAHRFLIDVFHLLGYRKRRERESRLEFTRRPFDRRSPFVSGS